jgi:hypothetical protein
MRQRTPSEAALAAGWIAQYMGETDPDSRKAPKEDELEAGRRRRRIEDILEASRLEREALHEVWDQS